MGVFRMFSRSSYDSSKEIRIVTSEGNPNPKNFKLGRIVELYNYLLVWINYPDCNNYEGNKILVFKDLTKEQIEKFNTIDPHFSKNKDFKSPIARFVPTDEGWDLAIKMCTV